MCFVLSEIPSNPIFPCNFISIYCAVVLGIVFFWILLRKIVICGPRVFLTAAIIQFDIEIS